MGKLVDGAWKKSGFTPDSKGAFQRAGAQFRRWITIDGKQDGFAAEPGRYHIYAAYACPWAHRTLIARALRGLEHAVGVTIVDAKMSDEGWSFGGEVGEVDPLFGETYLRDIYLRASPSYSGSVTVPVLWDKKTNTIVNNESREIMRMLDTVFDAFAENPTSLLPRDLATSVDSALDAIYAPYNNGVYRAGFATEQRAYEEGCREVFATLDRFDELLAKQRYVCGDRLTEADIAFFTTSLRFDLVYHAHFKLNVRRIQDYPNVWGFVRDVYQMPEVRKTCVLDQIKTHYYWSQPNVNPHRIVPLGPTLDLDAPHRRERLSKHAHAD